jgi:hypothetical protein
MRIEVLKQTSDDWYGSYHIEDWYKGKEKQMFVEVVFNGDISLPGETPIWRTCVWGNDDCGMEYDCDTEAEAFNKFLQVIGQESVTREFLSSLGFVSA